MRVVHWVRPQGSGLARVAQSLSAEECRQGMASVCVSPDAPTDWDAADGADVHVLHHHIPAAAVRRFGPMRVVFVGHGTPEHVYDLSIEAAQTKGYGHGDPFMLLQHWLGKADAVVTFWARHQAIYETMRRGGVDLLPMGVDRDFWTPGESQGKYAGHPSVFTAENQHRMKWVLDALVAWPWVLQHVPEAMLHAVYLPHDQHRTLFPLANANGAAYGAHLSALVFDPTALRNAFRSTDFYLGLVRYGDHNHVGMQAAASGAQVLSYRGNPYAHFWLDEGDQRGLAAQLVAILTGQVSPRVPAEVPTLPEMAHGFRAVYQRVARRGRSMVTAAQCTHVTRLTVGAPCQ